jgi:hypothetical protein
VLAVMTWALHRLDRLRRSRRVPDVSQDDPAPEKPAPGPAADAGQRRPERLRVLARRLRWNPARVTPPTGHVYRTGRRRPVSPDRWSLLRRSTCHGQHRHCAECIGSASTMARNVAAYVQAMGIYHRLYRQIDPFIGAALSRAWATAEQPLILGLLERG